MIKQRIKNSNKKTKQPRKWKVKLQWVFRNNLRSSCLRQDEYQLVRFLEYKKLVDNGQTTELAYKLGYAKILNNIEMWDVKKYHELVLYDEKVTINRLRGIESPLRWYELALVSIPK